MQTDSGKTMPAVLVVDDDPVCRLFCVHGLAASGYQTFAASAGDDAIRLALRERPQIILTDMHLPDMSGVQAMAAILKSWPDAKTQSRFIGLSGDDSPQVQSVMLAAGFALILAKPFQIETLLACVRKMQNQLLQVAKTQVPCIRQAAAIAVTGPQQVSGFRLQSVFCAELDLQLPELDRLITSLDWQGATEILHRLSGAAALAGYSAFAGCGRQLLQQFQGPQGNATLAETYLDLLHQAAQLLADRPLAAGPGLRHCE